MTSAPITRNTSPSTQGDVHHLRLRLKPRGPVTGFVDGAWWPRSRDLPAEIPGLLAVLAIRLGPVERVSYNLDAWGPTAHKITVDGRVVRLAGYRSQNPATIDVLSAGHRITLLVVPPEATALVAHRALMAAGRRANAEPITVLLAGTDNSAGDATDNAADNAAGDMDDAAQQQWDLDGGPVALVRGLLVRGVGSIGAGAHVSPRPR